MRNQKFKTTIFIPRLTEISSVVEIDVNAHDNNSDIEYKLLKKIAIYKENQCCLLKKNINSQASLSRLIEYRKIFKYGVER